MFSEVMGSANVDADVEFLIKSWGSQFGVTPKPKEWKNIVDSEEVTIPKVKVIYLSIAR